jgi:hypothetical protein
MDIQFPDQYMVSEKWGADKSAPLMEAASGGD